MRDAVYKHVPLGYEGRTKALEEILYCSSFCNYIYLHSFLLV